jgi:hypothetical protein
MTAAISLVKRKSPSGLIDFLESGPPPIVFTLGSTGIWVADNFYRDSIEAAQGLGR